MDQRRWEFERCHRGFAEIPKAACIPLLGFEPRYYPFETYELTLSNHAFVHYDLEFGLPFEDERADYIYSSHFLEHLPKGAAERMISEIYRVLKPGAVTRIVVPDLAFAVALYQRGEKKRMLEDYFFIEHDAGYFARHKYMYDFEMMDGLLRAAGFRQVKRCAYREGRMPDIDHLDNRPEDSLYVEADK